MTVCGQGASEHARQIPDGSIAEHDASAKLGGARRGENIREHEAWGDQLAGL